MLDAVPSSWLRSRRFGPRGVPALLVRLAAGIPLVLIGIGKFVDRASEVRDFRSFGVPVPSVAVPLAGVIEVLGGLAVVVGLLTRPAALLVATNLVVALLTAGINEGGTFHLVVGPVLLVCMLVIAFVGPGPLSLDARILSRRSRPDTR